VFSDLGRVQHLKKKGVKIGVGGCVASQEGAEIIRRAPYVDVVFGPQTLHRLPELLAAREASGQPQVDVSFPEIEKFDHLPPARIEGASAFVSIMEGCSKYCSYCVVPYTRGEEVSRPLEDVLTEVAELVSQGVKEINLLGQNVNGWRAPVDGVEADFALLLDYVAAVHPRFDRAVAERFLAGTQVPMNAKVATLSKGMVTQLHLALVLAIRAPLLVLDEPTLGLDLPSRRAFYDTLLNDYMDGERTILVTTHQVEEIEHVLTDLLFIEQGRIVLDAPVETLGERFIQVQVAAAQVDTARALRPLHERVVFGRTVMLFDGVPQQTLAALGETGRPSVADLFLAKLDGQAEPVGRAA